MSGRLPGAAAPPLHRLAGTDAGAVAAEDPRRTVTWAELDARSNAIGHGLESLGLAPGSHVAIVAGNRLEFVESVLGAWRAGLVYTPLKTGWTPSELDHVLADAGTRAVITDRPAARAAAAVRDIPVLDLDDGFEGWLARQNDGPLPADRCGWKLPYTSGTTGRAKGVVPTGAGRTPFPAAWGATARYAQWLGLPGDGVHLFVSRLFHGAPLTFGLGALARGARLRILPGWEAGAALAALADPEVTSTIMVPTMLRQLLAAAGADRPALPGLRTLLHGGEPCPRPLKQALLDWLGPVLVEYYGFTEGGMTIADSATWLARPGTVGRPMPGLDLRILDDDGAPVPPHAPGTVCFVAPGRRFGYLHNDEATAAAHHGDAFTVGDIGWVDDAGYLFLAGRSTDVVISAGVNIYPAEIEDALADVTGVADLCAVGAPDPERGEAVVLHVTLVTGAVEADVRAALSARAAERLAPYKRPSRIEVRREIPRDPTGKLLRRALRDPLWAGVSR